MRGTQAVGVRSTQGRLRPKRQRRRVAAFLLVRCCGMCSGRRKSPRTYWRLQRNSSHRGAPKCRETALRRGPFRWQANLLHFLPESCKGTRFPWKALAYRETALRTGFLRRKANFGRVMKATQFPQESTRTPRKCVLQVMFESSKETQAFQEHALRSCLVHQRSLAVTFPCPSMPPWARLPRLTLLTLDCCPVSPPARFM